MAVSEEVQKKVTKILKALNEKGVGTFTIRWSKPAATMPEGWTFERISDEGRPEPIGFIANDLKKGTAENVHLSSLFREIFEDLNLESIEMHSISVQ